MKSKNRFATYVQFFLIVFTPLLSISIWVLFPKTIGNDDLGIGAKATFIGLNRNPEYGLLGRIYLYVKMNDTIGEMTAVPPDLTTPFKESAVWKYRTVMPDGHIVHEGDCLVQRMEYEAIPTPDVSQIMNAKGYSADGKVLGTVKDGNGTLKYEDPDGIFRVEIDFDNGNQSFFAFTRMKFLFNHRLRDHNLFYIIAKC